MGFFDRLIGKSSKGQSRPQPRPAPSAVTPPPPAAADKADDDAAAAHASAPMAAESGPVGPKLTAALEQLEVRNLDGARAIYEDILSTTAGDRPDVLVRISGDLGATGHIATIVELIAPRYDSERHGPATGINLLQAYLALRDPDSAQHVLDLLFALGKPELEERLWGFSNAIAELMDARRRTGAAALNAAGAGAPATNINLVSISKPIWAYGLDDLPGVLPAKTGASKRIAFAQLSLPELKDAETIMARPEDALGRFVRGFPLWLAETLHFSAQYHTLAAVGLKEQLHYALFTGEWTTDNLRQLIDTAGATIDYVVTGSLRERDGDFDLQLRLWEVKSFRERKSFTATWTPATADTALASLHQQLRFFFEWKPAPAGGLAYVVPASPTAWIETLGASLSAFLADKTVLPVAQLAPLPTNLADPASGEAAALALLTLADRSRRTGQAAPALDHLPAHDLVVTARAALGL